MEGFQLGRALYALSEIRLGTVLLLEKTGMMYLLLSRVGF